MTAMDPLSCSHCTVGELLALRAQESPDRPAYLSDGQVLTYGQLHRRADMLAAALANLGVAKGERVAMALPNGIDMVCLYFAIAKLGAVNVFVNRDYDAALLNELLDRLQPAAVILDSANLAKLDTRFNSGPAVRILWSDANADAGLADAGVLRLHALLSGSPPAPPMIDVAPTDPVQFIFTSGTTGLPKACTLSHRARIGVSAHINHCLGVTRNDRYFVCLPNYHGNVFLGIIGALLAGGSCLIAERFSASRYWHQAEQGQATILVLHAVPLNMLLAGAEEIREKKAGPAACHGVRAVVTVGGRYTQFMERFGIPEAVLGYGSTEAGGLTSLARISQAEAMTLEAGYAGRVRSDLEVRVEGPDGVEMPAGCTGELLVRPRMPHMMFSGYHAQPEATAKAFRNGWYRSGDRGSLDAAGNLYFAGRDGDTVRVKGEAVPVEYLEGLIRECGQVEDCAVIGVSHALGDEELRVFVQCGSGDSLTADQLIDYLRPKVPKYMIPASIVFVASFPRSPATMKILKRKLLE